SSPAAATSRIVPVQIGVTPVIAGRLQRPTGSCEQRSRGRRGRPPTEEDVRPYRRLPTVYPLLIQLVNEAALVQLFGKAVVYKPVEGQALDRRVTLGHVVQDRLKGGGLDHQALPHDLGGERLRGLPRCLGIVQLQALGASLGHLVEVSLVIV